MNEQVKQFIFNMIGNLSLLVAKNTEKITLDVTVNQIFTITELNLKTGQVTTYNTVDGSSHVGQFDSMTNAAKMQIFAHILKNEIS